MHYYIIIIIGFRDIWKFEAYIVWLPGAKAREAWVYRGHKDYSTKCIIIIWGSLKTICTYSDSIVYLLCCYVIIFMARQEAEEGRWF